MYAELASEGWPTGYAQLLRERRRRQQRQRARLCACRQRRTTPIGMALLGKCYETGVVVDADALV